MESLEKQFNQPKLSETKEESRNFLLEGPELVLPETERKQEEEMSFSFSSNTRRYYLGHKNGKTFFTVEYFDSLPDELSKEEKQKFVKETRKQGEVEKTVYTLKYGEVPEPKKENGRPGSSQSKKYCVAQPRDFERGVIDNFVAYDKKKQVTSEILAKHSELKPEEIEIVQLVEILKNKKVLFYTGAGISIASGVHSMNQLHETLGIEMSERVDGFLKKAVTNPQEIVESWEEFTKAAFEKPATPAHHSLGGLAQKLKSQIFTENVDYLQEKVGVKPVHLTGPWLKENIQPEWLRDIDAVVTVGLSYDDRGFLGWYKENNPNGKIIAINLNQPSYLGNEDFVLKGDCQRVIPELEKEFVKKG